MSDFATGGLIDVYWVRTVQLHTWKQKPAKHVVGKEIRQRGACVTQRHGEADHKDEMEKKTEAADEENGKVEKEEKEVQGRWRSERPRRLRRAHVGD